MDDMASKFSRGQQTVQYSLSGKIKKKQGITILLLLIVPCKPRLAKAENQ
jgi:hypothetical protein